VRPHAPIHLARRAEAPPPGLHLSPRGALPQVGGGSEWVHATLAIPEPESLARWDERLRALYVSVITELDQVPRVGRVVGAEALVGQPARRGDVWAVDLSFDLADVVALPDEPFYVHLASERLRSEAQRREAPSASLLPFDAAALTAGLDQLVVAGSLARAGDAVSAARLFASAFELPGVRADDARPHAFDAACAAARVAAAHGRRADLVDYALAWLDEDLRRSEALLLGASRALTVAPDGPERRRLLRRRAAVLAHLDARATDPDLAALRDTDAWRARAAGA
jgi:hypothetical protein